MPLHQDTADLLASMAAAGAPAISAGTPQQARANYDAAPKPPAEDVARVEDFTVPGQAGEIPVRLYAANDGRDLPVLVYFHGGGWVLSSIQGHDSLTRRLARLTGALVLSVDYRLAPEHPFPAAHDDGWSVLTWLQEHASTIGGDGDRLIVAGDSAGANIAAGLALRARDEGLPLLLQLLIYPCVEVDAHTESMRTNSDGYFLTAADMSWFWDQYLPADHRDNPYAVPGLATDLTGLAPALIQTAEYDPLRDEGEQWGLRLQEAGVPVTVTRYDGVIHGFVSRWHLMAAGEDAHREAADAVRAAFG